MAAANPSDLQKPPLNQKVLDPKNGLLSQAWNAWFTGLGTVASWVVRGALNVTGVFTMGAAVPTPANGQIGAGDAGWINVSGGVGFTNGWGAIGGQVPPRYRTLPEGKERIELSLIGGTNGLAAWTMPIGRRPAFDQWTMLVDNTTNGNIAVVVKANGQVIPTAGQADGVIGWIEYYPEA